MRGETSNPACEASLLQTSGWSANPCSCMEECLSKEGTEVLCTEHCETVAACVASGKSCEVCGEEAVSKEVEAAGAFIKDCVLKGEAFPKCAAKVKAYIDGSGDSDECSCMEECLSKEGTEVLCTEHCEDVAACVAGGKSCEVCGEEAVSKEVEAAGAFIKDCVLKGEAFPKCAVKVKAYIDGSGDSKAGLLALSTRATEMTSESPKALLARQFGGHDDESPLEQDRDAELHSHIAPAPAAIPCGPHRRRRCPNGGRRRETHRRRNENCRRRFCR